MEVVVKKNYEEMCQSVADLIIDYVSKKPESLIQLPGGDTPLGIFEALVKADKEGKIDFSKTSFVSLDEWENLGYDTKGSCIQTLYDCLYNKLSIDPKKQVCFFDGQGDLEEECKRIDKFVFEHGNIDISVLGIGMNGHIGFNEPGFDPDQYCTIIPLDEITKSVSVKYFGQQLNIEHGITLGFKHILNAKKVILIADSARKADIVRKVVEGPITNEVPASLVRKVKDSVIYLDEEAATKLNLD